MKRTHPRHSFFSRSILHRIPINNPINVTKVTINNPINITKVPINNPIIVPINITKVPINEHIIPKVPINDPIYTPNKYIYYIVDNSREVLIKNLG